MSGRVRRLHFPGGLQSFGEALHVSWGRVECIQRPLFGSVNGLMRLKSCSKRLRIPFDHGLVFAAYKAQGGFAKRLVVYLCVQQCCKGRGSCDPFATEKNRPDQALTELPHSELLPLRRLLLRLLRPHGQSLQPRAWSKTRRLES